MNKENSGNNTSGISAITKGEVSIKKDKIHIAVDRSQYDPDNIMAQIIDGRVGANKIYEDSKILVIKDIKPVAEVHVLVIPKLPCLDYKDFVKKATKEDLIYYFTKIDEVAYALGLKDGGYRLVTNVGEKAGQTVFHFHTHIIGGKGIKMDL